MTHVTINTHIPRSVTVHAPTHCLIYLATNAMHLAHLTVTGGTVDSSFYVRLVRVVRVRFGFQPVDALPRRLLLPLRKRGKLLNLGTLGLDRFVATHTSAYIWNSGVRRLVYVFVAESTLQLRSIVPFFSNVLPMVKFDRLPRDLQVFQRRLAAICR
jgi:hypothetical protein